MSGGGSETPLVARALVVLAVIFGICLGLCGISVAARAGDGAPLLAVIAGIGMGLSAAGIVVTSLVWFLTGIFSGILHRNDSPQRIFDSTTSTTESDKENDDQ